MRIGLARPVRFCRSQRRCSAKKSFQAWNARRAGALSIDSGGFMSMLVERGLQVTSVEVVGEAYAIASHYLRKAGAIPDNFATNERLIEIIVRLSQRGETNKIRLANKAIAEFEADSPVI
jgi:hypothetical protein